MTVLKPVQKGQPLQASQYNVLIQDHNRSQFVVEPFKGANQLLKACSIISGYNVGTETLNPFDICIMNGAAITNYGSNEMVVNITAPIIDDNMGHCGIVIDKCEPHTICSIVICGTYWVNYDSATDGAFGTPIAGTHKIVLSSVPGPLQLIAKSDATTGLALCRLGLPAQGDHYEYLVLNSQATSYLPSL
jgi:hypothetical protein